jgi:O-antigen/teichoic acid export membrane protein
MLLQSVIAMAAAFAGMGFAYLFHFFMARMLAPAAYGDLAVVIGIITVLSVPTGSMQTVLVREISKLDAARREGAIAYLLRRYALRSFAIGFALAIVLAAFADALAQLFNDAALAVAFRAVALAVPVGYVLAVARSYLQGKERIFWLSVGSAGAPLAEMLAGLALVSLGFGLLGASIAVSANVLAGLLLALPFLPWRAALAKARIAFGRSFALILATGVLHALFLYADLFFVKRYLSADAAGFYNVAAITSKVLFFAVGGITVVLLPKSAKLNFDDHKPQMRGMIAKSLLLLLPVFAAFMLFPRRIIELFYTERYLPAVEPFVLLGIAMFAFALFQILLALMWSQRHEVFPLLVSVAALAVDAVLLTLLVPSQGMVGAATATAVASAVFLVPSAVFVMRKL